MLFNSIVPQIIQGTIKTAATLESSQRKVEAEKRLDYYQSNQADYIIETLNEHFAHPERLTPVFVNLTRKIIDNLAMVYCEPAQRQVDGTERDRELYTEIAKTAGFNLVMKQASKLTKLLKTILIRPVWRNGQIDLDILTGEILDVETGDSPRDLKKVMVTDYPANGKLDEITYSLWTPETWQRLDYRGNVLESTPNPYKRLPFIPLWDSLPIDNFWVPGGQDIIDAQSTINERLTDLCYTLRLQGFGVPVLKSNDSGKLGVIDLDVGPGTAVNLPADSDADFKYEATEAPIEEIVAAIEFIIKQTAIANGLSAHSLTADPVNESGVAKIVSNGELQEKRQDDIELFRQYEHNLFDLTKTVWNTHVPGKKFSEDATLKIDFAEINSPTLEMDEADKWDRLIQMGQASMVDFAMARNPDLTRDQAKAYLQQVKEENAQFNSIEL